MRTLHERVTVLLAVFALAGGCDKSQTRPEPERAEAVGETNSTLSFHDALGDPKEIEARVRPLFADDLHTPKKPAKAGDWLDRHHEPGQTFAQFVGSRPNRPDGERDTIYILPLGRFDVAGAPSLGRLERVGEVFFQMEFEVMEPVDVSDAGITERRHPEDGQRQLLAPDVLDHLKEHLPDDAFCLLAVTMVDLYPDPTWNFVFGYASLTDRVGVYSFARYESDDPTTTLRRSLKVMLHETGHMFGIEHCIYYECLMNGSNHLQETDASPLFLGPVDHRKLMWSIGFDPEVRYRQLAALYAELGLNPEADRAGRLLSATRPATGD